MQSVDSVKAYCGTICTLSELKGYGIVHRGKRYYKVIAGLRRKMKREVQQAKPLTIDNLKAIARIVDTTSPKLLTLWVALLFGFFFFLRKSNLVPTSRVHDPLHQLSRRDIKLDGDLMIVNIKWSKTNQYGKNVPLPMLADYDSVLCPVRWLKLMLKRIPAQANSNLFSYWLHGQLVPITYTELQDQMREWLGEIGVHDTHRYSSHSMRRGGTNFAFDSQISECTIKILGQWVSDCYKRYIDLTIEDRLDAWLTLSNC